MLRTIGSPALLLATAFWTCAQPASCSATVPRGSSRSLAAGFTAALSALSAEIAFADSRIMPGDTAVVTSDQARFMVGRQVLATLGQGTVLRTIQVKDAWIGGLVDVAGEKQIGWVKESDLRLLASAAGDGAADDTASDPDTRRDQPAFPRREAKPDDFTVETLVCDSDSRLATIDRSARIQRLVLSGQGVTNTGLKHVGALEKVGTLSIERTRITDTGLSLLAGLKDVRSLRLWQSGFTNAAVDRIKGLTSLESLDLEGTHVHGEVLTRLQGLPNLRALVLGRETQDKELEHLKSLPRLEEIDLRGCRRVTDAGLAHLGELTKLRALWLPDSITDAGLQRVSGLTGLQRIWLPEQISDKAKEQLKARLPNCEFLPAEPEADSLETVKETPPAAQADKAPAAKEATAPAVEEEK